MKVFWARQKKRFRFAKPLWAAYRVILGAFPWRWLPGSSRTLGPPRGFHSTADYLSSGRADPRDLATTVAPAEVIVRVPPRTLDGATHWKYRELLRQDMPPVEVFDLHSVRFWGDGSGTIIGRDDRVLSDLTRDVWEVRRHRIFTRFKLPPCWRLGGITAILSVAEADKNYWHWTLEVLPRLELLRLGGFPVASIDWFVVNHRDRGYDLETLEALGVPRDKIVRADASLHIECERLVTTSLKPHHNAVTAAACGFLNAWAARRWPEARSHRRLYLSRRRSVFRRVINEEAVVTKLRTRGFEVIECETLSAAGQQRAFREAAVVVAPHGSGLANLVYCQPGTKILEFMAPNYVDLSAWYPALELDVWLEFGVGPHPPEGVDPMARQDDILVDLGRMEATLRAMGV